MIVPNFSAEIQKQATVFDNIGSNYESIFGNNPAQIMAVEWLIQQLPANARILDLGSGTGVPTAKLLTEAGHHVVGVDISQKMVQIAQQQVPKATFHQMEISNLQLTPEPFHAITAFFSLLMMRKSAIESTLASLATHLQSPGYLILAMVEGEMDFVPVPFIGQTAHVSAYLRDDLTQILTSNNFAIVDTKVVEFQANEAAPPEIQLFFFCQHHVD